MVRKFCLKLHSKKKISAGASVRVPQTTSLPSVLTETSRSKSHQSWHIQSLDPNPSKTLLLNAFHHKTEFKILQVWYKKSTGQLGTGRYKASFTSQNTFSSAEYYFKIIEIVPMNSEYHEQIFCQVPEEGCQMFCHLLIVTATANNSS